MEYNENDLKVLQEADEIPPFTIEDIRNNHLLVGGASGSGKSTVLHKIIDELLKDPVSETLLILCDPKRVELSQYKRDKHVIKYGNDCRTIEKCLNMGLDFMTYRYKNMERRHLQKWDGSHLYIIIEEVADLLTTDRKLFEPLLQRLLQLGRASNIHLIILTQNCAKSVIIAPIQCNIVNRLALYCEDAIASRQIIGVKGAEELPFNGFGILKRPREVKTVKIELEG